MSPDLLPFLPKRRTDFEAAGELQLPYRMDTRTMKTNNSLSRHVQFLRRRSQSSGRWHFVAVLAAFLIALVMAGIFGR